MSEPCTEYDSAKNRCKSGFPVTNSLCWRGTVGCHACGALEKANAHCNWVMRRHPDGGLVSVRKATHLELAHARVRQHLRAGVAQLTRPDAAGADDACAHSYANKFGCPECGEETPSDAASKYIPHWMDGIAIPEQLTALFEKDMFDNEYLHPFDKPLRISFDEYLIHVGRMRRRNGNYVRGDYQFRLRVWMNAYTLGINATREEFEKLMHFCNASNPPRFNKDGQYDNGSSYEYQWFFWLRGMQARLEANF